MLIDFSTEFTKLVETSVTNGSVTSHHMHTNSLQIVVDLALMVIRWILHSKCANMVSWKSLTAAGV
jgi:hypothetical protein